MKKVLIITNSSNGLFSFRNELIEKLLHFYKVIIITPDSYKKEYYEDLGCDYKILKFNRRTKNIFQELKTYKFLKKIIKNIKPDIVLSYTIKPNIYGGFICKKYNIPFFPNITGLGTEIYKGNIFSKILLGLYKISLNKARCIFLQNNYNLEFLKKNRVIKKQKSILLPGSGVNINKFKYIDYPTSNKINFLFVGRVMKDKGIEELLNAIKYIKDKYDNVEFSIVGRIEEMKYKEIIMDYAENNYLNYFGQVSDVLNYYKNAHAIVLPTYHEGLSNVLLEASACGRPVLASRIPGCKETFIESVTGFGFNSKDTSDLINKLEKFIDLNYETKLEMGIKANEFVKEKFNRDFVIEKYMEEIQECL